MGYRTIKQRIYAGKIKSVKTPGRHLRIPTSEIDRSSGGKHETLDPLHKLSEMQ